MPNRTYIARAFRWSAIDLLLRYGLNFVTLVILARILTPADFGLMAMLTLFVAISGLLIDSGFSQAIIQRQQTTPTDQSTIFIFTVMVGGLVALILCILAPVIATFYGQPLLEEMTYWMALNLFLSTLGAMHATLLSKELDFKTIVKVGGLAALVSGSVAIAMAMRSFGVWSLVGQVLASTVTSVIMRWLVHPWRPQWVFSFSSLRTYFKFGGFLLLTGLLNALHTNLYALLIGKLHSVQEVGFYAQARRLQQLPINLLTGAVSRVAFPVFAAATDDKERLARGLRQGMISIMFINIPTMLGLMVMADPLILTLFGPQWLSSVPVLRVLAMAGLFWPLHALNVDVLKAQGHSALNAQIQLIKLSMAIALLLLTSPYGILAIAYGQVAASLLFVFVNAHYTKILLNYGGVEQLRDVAPYFAAALPMVLSIWMVQWALALSAQTELFIAMVVGGGIYLLVCKANKLDAIKYLMLIFNNR